MITSGPTTAARAMSRIDLLATILFGALLIAGVLPALAHGRTMGFGSRSRANLSTLGFAHAIYAADWNGRQYTVLDDELSTFGEQVYSAMIEFESAHGYQHPPLVLGWGFIGNDEEDDPQLFAYRLDGNGANAHITLPINYSLDTGQLRFLGSSRLPNARAFRQYVSTRFYSPAFYAPHDVVVAALTEPLMTMPYEFYDTPDIPGYGSIPLPSSYALSPAAMYDPGVLRRESNGGYQHPFSYDDGCRSPALAAARYPSLKTFMIEHHWLQNAPPITCNPEAKFPTYNGCQPYQFNHGLASAPATLFYDLSVRELPNTAVQATDLGMIERTGEGIWHRGTPWGATGYQNDIAYDDVDLSHHMLTTDGILGRDTTAGR